MENFFVYPVLDFWVSCQKENNPNKGVGCGIVAADIEKEHW